MDSRRFGDPKARAKFVDQSFSTMKDIDYSESANMLAGRWNAI
jgi:hypothetical protein